MSDVFTDRRARSLLEGLVRVGRVSEVGAGRVRVTWADRDGVASPPLQVLHDRTRGQRDYCMPEIDEPVLCLMLPPDQVDGFVLGSLYDAKQEPPTTEATRRVVASEDLRLGGAGASHDLARGDIVHKLFAELFALLRTMVIPVPLGVAPLTGDTAGTNDYGTGGLTAVLTAMEGSEEGLAGLLNDKIKTE